jgi:hypothetical protein
MVLQRDMPVPVWISVTGANERGMKNLEKMALPQNQWVGFHPEG